MRRILSLALVFFLVVAGFLIFVPSLHTVQGVTLYVGGSGGGNHSTIQDAIDAANPGDTIYVFLGTYEEDLVINKTINLVGESKHSTIIDTTGSTFGLQITGTHFVNISGFTIKGANSATLRLVNANSSRIFDNMLINSIFSAIVINPGSYNLVEDNRFIDNLNGIIISGDSKENTVESNDFEGGEGRAISFENNAQDNMALGNIISDFTYPGIGIYVYESQGNEIKENQISNGFEAVRIFAVDDIEFSDNVISGNTYGINASSADFVVFNCSLENIDSYDLWLSDPDSVDPIIVFYNTTFDENAVMITGSGSRFHAYFNIKIKVVDEEGKPAAGISVITMDNVGSSPTKPYTTDSEGIVGPLNLFGFMETETQRNYSTPYNISAFGTNLLGWASPEVEFGNNIHVTIMIYLDSDGDDVFDKDDDFPSDETQWEDNDGDGYGDNPQGNNPDLFPQDPLEWSDSDSDGLGDNADAFPQDPTEQNDTDSDGVGDNSDAFPNDPKESKDTDSDGVGDNADEFPDDPDEWEDSDSDGVGDNSDFMPELNNVIFFSMVSIIIIIVILVLLLLTARRRRRPPPFDRENDSE
jgi:parallel beta-helix repeat protein